MDWNLAIVALIGSAVFLTAFHIWTAKDFHRLTNGWEYEDGLPSTPEDPEAQMMDQDPYETPREVVYDRRVRVQSRNDAALAILCVVVAAMLSLLVFWQLSISRPVRIP